MTPTIIARVKLRPATERGQQRLSSDHPCRCRLLSGDDEASDRERPAAHQHGAIADEVEQLTSDEASGQQRGKMRLSEAVLLLASAIRTLTYQIRYICSDEASEK